MTQNCLRLVLGEAELEVVGGTVLITHLRSPAVVTCCDRDGLRLIEAAGVRPGWRLVRVGSVWPQFSTGRLAGIALIEYLMELRSPYTAVFAYIDIPAISRHRLACKMETTWVRGFQCLPIVLELLYKVLRRCPSILFLLSDFLRILGGLHDGSQRAPKEEVRRLFQLGLRLLQTTVDALLDIQRRSGESSLPTLCQIAGNLSDAGSNDCVELYHGTHRITLG